MGTTSICNVVCGGLTEIADILNPVINVPRHELQRLCTTLANASALDQVTIEPIKEGERGTMTLAFEGRAEAGSIRFQDTKSGSASTLPPSEPATFLLGGLSAVLIGGLLGNSALSQEGEEQILGHWVLGDAANYMHCLQTQDHETCAEYTDTLRRNIAFLQASRDPVVGNTQTNFPFTETTRLWTKADNFLRAGREKDSDNNDLDTLDQVLEKYKDRRPTGTLPLPVAEVRAANYWAHEMMREFNTSGALRAFAIDYGTCTETRTSWNACPATIVETIAPGTVCTFAGYAFRK
ncbi:MAG: hypothetical protein HY696_10310 [Deltaproteobacteria bacterium]|nr:hypothetical protein [Deltaproteobacteria bacterium]